MGNLAVGVRAARLHRVIAEAAYALSGGIDAGRIEAGPIVIGRYAEKAPILFTFPVCLRIALLSTLDDPIEAGRRTALV